MFRQEKFLYEKSFTNSVTMMIQHKMKCCKVRGRRVMYSKEGFRFYIVDLTKF